MYIVYSKTNDNGHIFKIKTYVFVGENSQVYEVYANTRIHTIPASISVTNIYVSPWFYRIKITHS